MSAYRIVRQLGAGGWGTVYEVETADGQRLALKRLGAELTPATQARFRREVESLRRIRHPGVLHLIDAGEDGAVPFLVTPLVTGASLRDLLARGASAPGAVGVEASLAIVAAAADAVAAIHGVGLVHRDLKPEHLMITPAGDVVVIDLGLAIGPEHSRHTAEDTLTGSVPYMSPEQIDDRAPSPASDVWALGVVLYEAIAGRRPFARARQSEEVAAILAGRFAALDELTATCPPQLARLVASCLAAAPAQRPPDAAALAAALLGMIDWLPPGASSTHAAHEALAAERARLVADPDSFAAATRARRVDLCAAAAERALASGDRFAATREVERGLAYAPDAPALRALVEKLMSGPVRGSQTVKGYAAPGVNPSAASGPRGPDTPGPQGGLPETATQMGNPGAAVAHLGNDSGGHTPSVPLPASRPAPVAGARARGARWPLIAGVAAVVAIIGAIASATGSGSSATSPSSEPRLSPGPAAGGAASGAVVGEPGIDDGLEDIDELADLPRRTKLPPGGVAEKILDSRAASVQASRPAHVKPGGAR
ncbi:MAG TPA: serine/threonine-protein kinase [Kofleriaceae bacterium]|nr:serine/threonine-protein kinase [Kofleriaceae bacterium]